MPVMTWERLRGLIEDGRGQGHGDDYKPWLWIHRGNSSRRGNQIHEGGLPGYRRSAHFLSAEECQIGLLCLYLGASDIREQFPIWPFPHLHPLHGLNGSTPWPIVRGLIDIAAEAGIKHGDEVGSAGVPYVATVDLAVTVMTKRGPHLAGIMVKPFDEVNAAAFDDRLLERLELQRRYLSECGAHSAIADRSLLGDHTAANLDMFSSVAILPSSLHNQQLLDAFSDGVNDLGQRVSIDEAIRRTGEILRLRLHDENLLWRHAVWTRRIAIDITRQVRTTEPLQKEICGIDALLAEQLFGEVPA